MWHTAANLSLRSTPPPTSRSAGPSTGSGNEFVEQQGQHDAPNLRQKNTSSPGESEDSTDKITASGSISSVTRNHSRKGPSPIYQMAWGRKVVSQLHPVTSTSGIKKLV